MERLESCNLYKDYKKYEGQTVMVAGWIKSIRDSKVVAFIDLNDGSFKGMQIVLEKDKLANYEDVKKLNIGSSLIVEGTLVESVNANQVFEINASKIIIEGECAEDYPIQKKRMSMDYLRDNQDVRCRTNTFNAVFRIRSVAAFGIHQFFQNKNFVYVNTPILTGSDCEGAGDIFQVTTLDLNKLKTEELNYENDFFGKQVGLTVSGQLQEECFTHSFGNTYTFGPTFRAEHSNTARHAAEFWMMEPELCFADLGDVMQNMEEMTKYVVRYVMNKCVNEIEFLNKFVDTTLKDRLNVILSEDFVKLDYTDAIKMLEEVKDQFEFPIYWGVDLQSEHERYLTEKIYKKPVFLKNYPRDIKSFYMRDNDDGKTVAAVDLLLPGVGELMGGSQREERYDVLVAKMKEFGMKVEDYKYYTDIRRFGTCKHGGYGLGFERLVMYITGISNIRDVLLFPRCVGKIDY